MPGSSFFGATMKPENHGNEETTPRRSGASAAVRYWDQNLDPQNLERSRGVGRDRHRPSLEDEIHFAMTPDLEDAAIWLEGDGTSPPAWILDLGAGLGAGSFALVRRGWRVVALDSSPARLRALKARAIEAGCADAIFPVAAAAEALPFADASVRAVYTKSVLIHTDLAATASELHRTLAAGGRVALVEPQTGHPILRIYRRWFAPRAWRAITRYFNPARQHVLLSVIDGSATTRRHVAPFYFLSFPAFLFQFVWPSRRLFHFFLGLLHPLDRFMFRLIPPLGRWAWFGLMLVEKGVPNDLKDQTNDNQKASSS